MSAIIDHVSLGVAEFEAARRFCDRVMPTLGLRRTRDKPAMVAFGNGEDDDFGLTADDGSPRHGTHLAFRAPDRQSVDRFHAEAMTAGGRDDGAPGLRPEYHPAFVNDPSGNRIEAVCHDPVET